MTRMEAISLLTRFRPEEILSRGKKQQLGDHKEESEPVDESPPESPLKINKNYEDLFGENIENDPVKVIEKLGLQSSRIKSYTGGDAGPLETAQKKSSFFLNKGADDSLSHEEVIDESEPVDESPPESPLKINKNYEDLFGENIENDPVKVIEKLG
ncbi:MAG: hypothetical protein SVY15_01880, partial [Halobacteriota archaeon]|nr:hypothetical protein [Halobacteriota archaeon]